MGGLKVSAQTTARVAPQRANTPGRKTQLRLLRFLLISAAGPVAIAIIGAAYGLGSKIALIFACGCALQLVLLAAGGWYYFRIHGAQRAKTAVKALKLQAWLRYFGALCLTLIGSLIFELPASQLASLLFGYIYTYIVSAFFFAASKF